MAGSEGRIPDPSLTLGMTPPAIASSTPYIQPGGPDSFSAVYAREVRAVQRAGFDRERFIAMHMKLGSWVDIERIALRGDN